MSDKLVARRLLFTDKVRGNLRFYAIDHLGTKYADGWEFLEEEPELLHLVSKTTAEALEQAFLRYKEPLIKSIRYSGPQCLLRWPERLKECYLWGGCVSECDICWVPSKNKCEMYQPGKRLKEATRIKLQELYNLWRDGFVVILVEKA